LSETQEIERPEHWRDHHPDHHRSKASPRRRRARLTLVSAVVSALAFGGVYGAALALEGQVPTGTVVDDVAIGGMTRSAAEAKLADVLGPVLAAPIRLTADGTPLTLDPEQAGLKVDWAATVAAASDGRDDPFVAVPALLGTKRGAGLRISIDRTALRAAIVEATSGFDRPLIEGGVTFPGGVPTPIAPRPGRVVDVDAAVGTVANAFTNGAATPASGNSSAAASSLGGDRVEPAAMAVAPHASPVTPTAPSSAPVSAKTPTALPTSAVPATPGTPTTPRAPKTPAPTPVPSGPSAIPTITLLVRDVQPTVTPAAVAQAMQDLARPAMSGPLTVVTGTIKTTLKPPVLGEYLAIVPDGHGGLVPRLDGAGVRTEIDQTALAKLEQSAVNAAFTVTDGKPVLVPGKTGIGYAPAAIDEAVLPALAEQQASQRTVTVPLGPLPPVLTTEAAGALGVTDVVGTYTAPLTASSQRAANVRRAADLVRGQIVQPGQTFSLNQALGARTAANGFVPAGASDTTGSQDAGAGASLVATALFNAEYLAGLKDVEHHPHAVATDRFPAGMEAALAYPDVDLKFQNDSGSPIYLWTQVTDNAVTVAVLGQKAYAAVQTEVSPHYEVVQPKTVTGSSGSCTVQDGVAGFQIDVTRILTKDGQEPVRQVFHTSYGAQDKIVCPAQGSSSGAANGPGAGSPQAMAPTPASTSGSSAAGTVGGTVGGTAGGTGGGGVTGGSTTPPATTSGPPSSWDGTLLGGLLGAPQPSKR
jgi:vancomycin resistance protein YoaR